MSSVFSNTGKGITTARLKGAGTEPNYIAWGTGAGTSAATDTALFSESAHESRVAGTSSQQSTSVANDTYQVVGTLICATAAKTITNVGQFDASTAGNLFNKFDFPGISLNVGDGIQFTMKTQYQ